MTNSPIKPAQLKQLHILLQQTGQTAFKQDLMDFHCIDGRYPTSSKDLYEVEAAAIIKHLNTLKSDQELKCDNMRKKVISCLREVGYNIGTKADMPRIYEWVQKYSATKKHLNTHTYQQLVNLVTQAERVRDSYLKSLKK